MSEEFQRGLSFIAGEMVGMRKDIEEIKKVLLVGNGQPPFIARLSGVESWQRSHDDVDADREKRSRRAQTWRTILISAINLVIAAGMLALALRHR